MIFKSEIGLFAEYTSKKAADKAAGRIMRMSPNVTKVEAIGIHGGTFMLGVWYRLKDGQLRLSFACRGYIMALMARHDMNAPQSGRDAGRRAPPAEIPMFRSMQDAAQYVGAA